VELNCQEDDYKNFFQMISNSKPNNYEGDFEINENYEDQNYNDNDSVDSLNLDYLPNEKIQQKSANKRSNSILQSQNKNERRKSQLNTNNGRRGSALNINLNNNLGNVKNFISQEQNSNSHSHSQSKEGSSVSSNNNTEIHEESINTINTNRTIVEIDKRRSSHNCLGYTNLINDTNIIFPIKHNRKSFLTTCLKTQNPNNLYNMFNMPNNQNNQQPFESENLNLNSNRNNNKFMNSNFNINNNNVNNLSGANFNNFNNNNNFNNFSNNVGLQKNPCYNQNPQMKMNNFYNNNNNSPNTQFNQMQMLQNSNKNPNAQNYMNNFNSEFNNINNFNNLNNINNMNNSYCNPRAYNSNNLSNISNNSNRSMGPYNNFNIDYNSNNSFSHNYQNLNNLSGFDINLNNSSNSNVNFNVNNIHKINQKNNPSNTSKKPLKKDLTNLQNEINKSQINNNLDEKGNENYFHYLKDQSGCRLLQKKIEKKNFDLIMNFHNQVIKSDVINDIIIDQFGNYVIQKYIEVTYKDKKIMTELFEKMENRIFEISINSFGTRVLQKALDLFEESYLTIENETINRVMENLVINNMMGLILDTNGNHVFKKIISLYPKDKNGLIYERIKLICIETAKLKQGGIVLQKAFEKASIEQKVKIEF